MVLFDSHEVNDLNSEKRFDQHVNGPEWVRVRCEVIFERVCAERGGSVKAETLLPWRHAGGGMGL